MPALVMLTAMMLPLAFTTAVAVAVVPLAGAEITTCGGFALE